LAAERLVTRHIRVLRDSITSFAHGARQVGELDMTGAATEIRDVANAYLKMTDTILHDEAELEDIAYQREVLLREVHHRVKNNLQLIASIMNMQMRQARNPEARALLKSLQDRVMSLATVHRELYQTSGLTSVRADELLAQIVRQTLGIASGPERRFDVVTSFDELRLTPDQAVPLSLLLTEALTNAIKYSHGENGNPPWIEITLKRDNASGAVLEITNSISASAAPAPAVEGTGLGADLLAAFAMQLGGRCGTEVTKVRYRLWVSFEVLRLAEVGISPTNDPLAEVSGTD
jgi:two-component sensor histidine kinase